MSQTTTNESIENEEEKVKHPPYTSCIITVIAEPFPSKTIDMGMLITIFFAKIFCHMPNHLPLNGPNTLSPTELHSNAPLNVFELLFELRPQDPPFLSHPARDPRTRALRASLTLEAAYYASPELASTLKSLQVVVMPHEKSEPEMQLAVFDMDSTLIQQEVIDELAECMGNSEQMKAVTRIAMEGELDFKQSLTDRVRLLKGLDVAEFETVRKKLTLNPGVRNLIRALKKLGCKTAVVSGGFDPLVKWLSQCLGLDYHYGNRLEWKVEEDENGKKRALLTGKLAEFVEDDQPCVIVDAEVKKRILKSLSENMSPASVLAIGDGANDLLMLEAAGVGVAWNAKNSVKKRADVALDTTRISDVLYLLGLTVDQQEELFKETESDSKSPNDLQIHDVLYSPYSTMIDQCCDRDEYFGTTPGSSRECKLDILQ